MGRIRQAGVTEEAAAGIAAFVRRGARLLPVTADERKEPFVKGYADAATSSLVQLQAWAERWPGCNWAVYTSSTFLVIDVDARKDGHETLAKLERELGPLPPTPRVLTSEGGYHLYFAYHQAVPTASDLAPGIDVRSRGRHSYVIIPGSVHHTGHVYRWADGLSFDDLPVATMPDRWLEWLAGGGDRPAAMHVNPTTRVSARKAPFALPSKIDEGSRDDLLHRYASSLRGLGAERHEIEDAVSAANAERCHPPLDARQVSKIAASACKYEPGLDAGRTRRRIRQAEQLVAFAPVPRTVRLAYLAHLRVAWAANSLSYRASSRRLALEAGLDTKTIAKQHKLLARDGLLTWEDDERSTRYLLDLRWIEHDEPRDLIPFSSDLELRYLWAGGGIPSVGILTPHEAYMGLVRHEIDRHLAFKGYGNLDFATYALLRCEPSSRSMIAAALGATEATARDRTRALRDAGLASFEGGMWSAVPTDTSSLDLLALEAGWTAKEAKRRDLFEQERRAFADLPSQPVAWGAGLTPTHRENVFLIGPASRVPDSADGYRHPPADRDHGRRTRAREHQP